MTTDRFILLLPTAARLALALLIVAPAGPSHADLTDLSFVTSPSGLGGSPLWVEDFEGGDPVVDFNDPRFATYYGSGASAANATGGVTPSGLAGFRDGPSPILGAVGPIQIIFDVPTRSVGMWFGNDDPTLITSGTVDGCLSAYSTTNALIGTACVQANMNDYADQFIGFNSKVSVRRVVFDYQLFGNSVGIITRYIDDVMFNVEGCFPAPTPEELFADADGDGEHDQTDECPATAADATVDAAGCSQLQYCAAFDVSTRAGRGACNSADWTNDQPLGAHDCLESRGVCLPVN